MALKFEVMTDGADSVPLLDAATILLLRDGDVGVEVLMMMRNIRSDFVGGAYVFPGGAVDDMDGDPEHLAACREIPPAWELTPRVAAVRESFEEAGVLLATDASGNWASPQRIPRWSEYRKDVDSGRRSVASLCEEEGLVMAVDQFLPFARWVTPVGAPRRYDTRFYVAATPPEQAATADNRELMNALWIRPTDALERYLKKDLSLIFPTARSLMAIADFRTVDDVLRNFVDADEPDPIEPGLRFDRDRHYVVLPDGTTFDGETAQPVEL